MNYLMYFLSFLFLICPSISHAMDVPQFPKMSDDQAFLTFLKLGNYFEGKSAQELKELGMKAVLARKENEQKAISFAREAALHGDVSSFCFFGYLAYGKQNLKEAYDWFALAFQAQWELTGEHHPGAKEMLEKINSAEAKKLLSLFPINENNKDTYLHLHNHFADRVKKSIEKKFQRPTIISDELREITLPTMRYGVKAGLSYAMLAMGHMYATQTFMGQLEKIVPKMSERYTWAQSLFERSYEKSGEVNALFNVGALYQSHKIGLELSEQERMQRAADIYKKIIKGGHDDAKFHLALAYLTAEIDGLSAQARNEEAHRLLKKIKVKTPTAHFVLFTLYQDNYIGKDLSPARRYQKMFSYLKESGNAPKVLYNLGCMYLNNQIPEKMSPAQRYQKAAEYFLKANCSASKLRLGRLYYEGYVGKDLSEQQRMEAAKKYYEESDLSLAKINLAILYLDKKIGREFSPQERYQVLEKLLFGIEPTPLHQIVSAAFLYSQRKTKLDGLKDDERRQEIWDLLEEHASEKNASYLKGKYYQKGFFGQELSEIERLEAALQNYDIAVLKGHEDSKKRAQHLKRLLEEKKKQSVAAPAVPVSAPSQDESKVAVKLARPVKRIEKKPKKDDSPKTSAKVRKLQEKLASEKAVDVELEERRDFMVEFASPKVEQDFESIKQERSGKKLQEIMLDILEEPWGTSGVGKPEILKNGFWSRRLNAEDRLVYDIQPGKIIIYSCKGHYQD